MNLQLLVLQGRPKGKTLLLEPGDYYLGRGPECHIRFNSDWVSRQHCFVRVANNFASLRDLGSRNGTLLNGQLLAGENALHEGDRIQIGPLLFEVHLDFPPQPSKPTPFPPAEILRSEDQDSSVQEPLLDSTVLRPGFPTDIRE